MTVYKVDPMHSSIEFRIKHLMITTVSGHFLEYNASIETVREADDFNDAIIQFSADVASLNTGVADRDTHLKSAEIFNVARWPKIYYTSKAVVKNSHGDYDITGTMTVKNVTRNLKLRGVYKGIGVDIHGVKKHGFEVDGQLSRRDFDLHISNFNGADNTLVDDTVKLIVNVQMMAL